MNQATDESPNTRSRLFKAEFSITRSDIRKGLTYLAVAVGLLFRLLEYVDNRQLYLDEKLLLENLTDLPIWDLHTVLSHDQLAPPGFLILERIMVRLPLPIVPSARFIPFIAAILTMLFFPKVARKYVDPRAVPLAAWLFALGDYSIYYAAEIKQYSVEVALALMALGLMPTAEQEKEPAWFRQLAVLGVFGAVAVWFSFPLIFSLAGIGLVGFATQVRLKDWKAVGVWTGIGVAWLASFGSCFLVSDRIVTKAPFLRTWWDFAFLRIPPKSLGEAKGVFWQIVNVIIDPTGVVTPFDHFWTVVVCGPLILVGLVALTRRSPRNATLLISPFLFAVVAAALKHYPFHGRLIQFLIPSVVFLLAEGVAFISRRGGTGFVLAIVLSAFLVAEPAYDALYYRLIQGRARPFDSHGDLHNDLLDEFEFKSPSWHLPHR